MYWTEYYQLYKKHNAELRQILDDAFRPARAQSVSRVSHAG